MSLSRRAQAVFAAAAVAALSLFLGLSATPAQASPVDPGGFCDRDELGQTRQSPSTGRWYLCTAASSGNTRHWRSTPSPAPSTCGGYGTPCPTPTASPTPSEPTRGQPGYGPTPTRPTLPKTSSTNPTRLTALLITGGLAVAVGAALLYLVPKRAPRHRRARRIPA